MKTSFKSLGLGTLALMIFWSCNMEEIASPQQAVLVDPLPVAWSYYDLEKPKQGNLYGRIQSDLDVFPNWEGAKSYSEGKILIVPAHRKVKATYAQGYLRRLVFQLDEKGKVLRGGILEMAGKDGDFLLENEEVLIEGFLSGVKSSQLTYLWSDFGSNPLDAIQSNGQKVERSVDRLMNSKRGTARFSFENCTDWYWVYSVGGVVVYEEYSHTTCGSGGCGSGLRTNSQDACLDEGTGGGGGEVVDEIDMKNLKYCHQNIIRELIGSTRDDFKSIFDKFNGYQPVPYNYNVQFQYGECVTSSTALACTKKSIFENWITVNINENVTSESTDILMGVTFLHEMLHAYMQFELEHHHNCDLNCLMNDYLVQNGGISSQHALFAESRFINDMAFELRNFASARGYNVSQLGDRYFKDLVWGGLSDTDAFKSLPLTDQNRIKNTFNSELKNMVQNGISPKGIKACLW